MKMDEYIECLKKLVAKSESENWSKEKNEKERDKLNTRVNSKITDICKNCHHALSLSLSSYFIKDSKLYQGWWDQMSPRVLSDIFKNDEMLKWLERNISGATHFYYLTGFWGVDHTEYYVFEYGEGNYLIKEHTYAIT